MDSYRMTDIHMHIIPGVDDGSFTVEMSETMLMMSWIQGVRTVFSTPHSSAFLSDPDLVWEQYRLLKERTERLPFSMRLYAGCEVRFEPRDLDEILTHLRTGRIPSMNHTRYVLTEFSTRVLRQEALGMISEIRKEGWIPILAHTERYPDLFAEDTLDRILDMGCYLQINAYSLSDDPEGETAGRAGRLLSEKKVSFFGSDAHRLNHRPPDVEKGLKYLYEHCEAGYADAVAFGNALEMLAEGERDYGR